MRRLFLAVVALGALACSSTPTTPARPTNTTPARPGASFVANDRPAPVIDTAYVSSTKGGLEYVTIVYQDTADPSTPGGEEAFMTAYFPPTSTDAAATANPIPGTAGTGQHTVTVAVPKGHCSVELWYRWADGGWGPFTPLYALSGHGC